MSVLLPIIIFAAATASPAEELRKDKGGRPVVGAYIDGKGPFDLVVDTAAQSSLIVEDLAHELRLPVDGKTLDVIGATGTSQARLYKVKRFANTLFDMRGSALIALPNAGSTSARGIIGMDLFGDRKLVFDQSAHSLAVEPSAAPGPGYVAVKGETTAVLSLVIPASLNGAPVRALVDTGAAVTMASPAALRAMGWANDDPRLKNGGEIRGATADTETVRLASIDRMSIGPVVLHNVPMIFPGEGAFSGSDASDEPMLILGSDILNLLDAFAIDLRRAEFQVRVPGAPKPSR